MANAIDPRIFAGELQPEVQPPFGAEQVVPELEAPKMVPMSTALRGTALDAQAAGIRQEGDREKANALEAAGAAVRDSIPGRLYDRLTKPSFEPQKDFNLKEFVDELPMVLNDDEKDYLKDTRSPEEANYKVGIIDDRRSTQQAMGDSPMAAMAASMLDPTYYVLTPAAAVVGRAAKGAMMGRVLTGATAGAGAAGLTAAGEGPLNESEIIINALANASIAGLTFKPGKGMVKTDPNFPDAELQRTLTMPTVADGVDNIAAVDNALKTRSQQLGEGMQWNMRKTMAGYGPIGKKVSDLLFDNNSDLSINSVEAHRAAVRGELTGMQRKYEDMMRAAVAEDGYGALKSIFQNRKASRAQASIEQDVQFELMRREQLTRQGRPLTYENVQPRVKAMADQLDTLHAHALKELKAAGVEGADELVSKAGWHHRKWSSGKIDDAMRKFEGHGLTAGQAEEKIKQLVGLSLRRANGWDQELSRDIGGAIVNRALRKGYFEDAMLSPSTVGERAALRDMLKNEGIPQVRMDRIMKFFEGTTDEQGKAGFMKHRVDLDYRAATNLPDGTVIRITDLIDNRLSTTVDQYLDNVSTQVALARKGLRKPSDIDDLRAELAKDIRHEGKRKEAVELFDNVINHLHGRPAGESVNRYMRMMQQYGRMIALKNSGLWQTTEYATMMSKYGIGNTLKYAFKELPVMKQMFSEMHADKGMARSLRNVLAEHSSQNVRLRPFLNRFEDNFEIGADDAASLGLQKASELVPYLNMMKYVHGHQAKVASNLILDRLSMASKGNAKARAALEKYGIGSQVMDKVSDQMKAHKWDVDKWDQAVWREVRPAFAKMMDESVLHGRLGDVPAFAAFDKVGKFMFTYRSFMLNAHNKVLAGGLARDGVAPTTFMLMCQMPLAMMAVQAQAALQGKELKEEDLIAKAMGQMGGLGVGSEIAGVLSGQRREFGAPALIPVDKAYQFLGSAGQGNFGQAGSTLLSATPLLGLLPPVTGAANLLKEQ